MLIPRLLRSAPSSAASIASTFAVLLLAACRSGSAASTRPPTTAPAASARPAHWGYAGEEGPAHWAELTPAYAACRTGAQSPIDLHGVSEGSATWTADYRTSALKIAHHEHVTDILDNGHTIQVTVQEGSRLETQRGSYALRQFHFHTPSEHTVDGKSFPMEIHFVHQAANGSFAVLAMLFTEGAPNPNLAQLISHFPPNKGETVLKPEVRVDLQLHLPEDRSAHVYMGSFTTPPCTEDVEWLVLREPVRASPEQLQAFAARLQHNNRPAQPLNGRAVVSAKLASDLLR